MKRRTAPALYLQQPKLCALESMKAHTRHKLQTPLAEKRWSATGKTD